ncbi:MAG: acyl-CoA/acyl-ACP dehydrogenase [Deltaproteobacteria bacterium]|nr:acyl-CoA/acyl-ACP dehydrogenase [Deltaproteobacteria bacterium]
MDFSYNDDQKAIRELARKMLEEMATHERLKEVKATPERVDRTLWRELAKANLLGVAIAEQHGGNGGWLTELALLMEEVGRAVAPVPVYPTLVLGALPLAEFGSDALKAKWLPRIASGDAILAHAIVDDRPIDVVTARRDGDAYVLNGTRSLVQAAHVADAIFVPARTDAGPALFVVDAKVKGVHLERVETTDEHLRPHFHANDVRVSAADVVGAIGHGDAIAAWTQQRATLALCAMQVGVAERALQITARYATERQQFDRPIGSFQAVHTRAGDAFVDVQAMKLTMLRALHLLEQREDATENLIIAKYWAADGGGRVAYAAQHLHGGIGVDVDYPIHRYYLWARQIGLHLGSGAEQVELLGERFARAR